MLTLIEGGLLSDGHEIIIDRISALVREGKRAYLIVPEQQTVSAEKEMTDLLPASAPLCFEVTNFTRFADTVFRSLGGLAGEVATSSKKALVMWRALKELSPILTTVNTRSEISAGSVKRMLGAIAKMQSFSVTSKELMDARTALTKSDNALTDPRLLAKLNDVASVMTRYNQILEESGLDSADLILSAEERLLGAKSDYLRGTEIFIDGFTSFTEPQYRLISALVKRCDTTVFLGLPKACPDAYEYGEIKETHSRMARLAALAEVDLKLQRIEGNAAAGAPLIAEAVSMLWRNSGGFDEELCKSDSIRIYEAQTPDDECDFIASDIKKRVMGGAKYSDFGIIARSLDAYEGILDTAFEKAEIPLFISGGSDISSYELIRLIYSAYSAISGGFDRSDVIAYSKCSLTGVPRNLADEFELYTEKWQISGKRFTDDVIWNMNPLGYSEIKPKNYEEKILLIDEARRAIITPLSNLADESKEALTVEDHAKSLVKFLVSLDIEEKLRQKSRETVQSRSTRSDMARLWKSLCGALEGMCEVIGKLEVSSETFLSLLKIAFSEIKIARIPAFCEQVVCGSADTARMQGKKYVYVIGVNSGVFPATVDDDDFFTEKDKSLLLSVGLSVSESSKIKSARELYLFSRAISYARVGVNISYTTQDSSFKSTPPSEAVTRIIEKSHKIIAPIKTSTLSPAERVYTKEYALEHLAEARAEAPAIKEALIRSGFDERLRISESSLRVTNAKLSEESLRMLYSGSVRTSASRLEKYSSCPMSYFCSYNLGLNEEEKAEFNSMNIGTFIHAVLENFFKELKERGKRISEITADEKTALIKRVSTEFAAKLFDGIPKTSARVQNTVNVLSRQAAPIIDSLCDEFSNCEYTPVFFELSIDNTDPSTPESPTFNTDTGHSLYLVGKVDRVDTYEHDGNIYVRVIDYKTGNKEFSPKDLEEGKNLQMFLYLKAITESKNPAFLDRLGNAEKLIPAGVIYVKSGIADGAVKKNDPNAALDSVKKEQKRLGMLLHDTDSLNAMNADFIPVKFKVSDGEPTERTKDRLYTEEGWKKLSATIENAVNDIAKRMTDGDIGALPSYMHKGKSTPCQWCGFKAICRNPNLK